ncbi:MAG: hypothetical protein ACTFAK_00960 [Candidatus Electronema sp. VV]
MIMAGRVEGLKNAEWKLFEDIFPGKDRRGRGMPAVRASAQNFEFAAVAADHRLPVVRFSARAAMGIKNLKPPAAQVMAS